MILKGAANVNPASYDLVTGMPLEFSSPETNPVVSMAPGGGDHHEVLYDGKLDEREKGYDEDLVPRKFRKGLLLSHWPVLT